MQILEKNIYGLYIFSILSPLEGVVKKEHLGSCIYTYIYVYV